MAERWTCIFGVPFHKQPFRKHKWQPVLFSIRLIIGQLKSQTKCTELIRVALYIVLAVMTNHSDKNINASKKNLSMQLKARFTLLQWGKLCGEPCEFPAPHSNRSALAIFSRCPCTLDYTPNIWCVFAGTGSHGMKRSSDPVAVWFQNWCMHVFGAMQCDLSPPKMNGIRSYCTVACELNRNLVRLLWDSYVVHSVKGS